MQDDYDLIPHTLIFTAGSKFEHDYFTGFNVQPTARLSWLVTDNQTLWTSVSRAVRTPSIIEDQIDLVALVTAGPNYYELQGKQRPQAEDLTAYEVGYRFQPTPSCSSTPPPTSTNTATCSPSNPSPPTPAPAG